MPIDIRRCAEAAARAALTEAFAPAAPPPPRRRGLRPGRAILLGAGMVTAARVALSAERRQALRDALASRLPLQELIDEIRREMEAEWTPDDGDAPGALAGELGEDDVESGAGDEEPAGAGEPEDREAAGAEAASAPDTADQGAPAPRRSPAAEASRRRRASRARDAGDGQRPRMPPHRGSRA
ncbi:MAG TPA: hypothetical protein VFN36_07180 [Solirubrobacteraceae bacterium]|nr:hypothetical protein [Solirubrobacteraceae bacterium]